MFGECFQMNNTADVETAQIDPYRHCHIAVVRDETVVAELEGMLYGDLS